MSMPAPYAHAPAPRPKLACWPLAIALAFLPGPPAFAAESMRKPNIVILLADDKDY